ncbi:GTP-binding protein [archaeon]|nr:MAG: GTP-binding protein [archaeon]
MADFEEVPEHEKTPVTIITGFLGSGKTTLVNYILKEQTSWKICVIENEFGEVPIDNDLVEENLAAREDIITMDNGCVCCSIRGDLVRTFSVLASRRKDFDCILIETTGVADPSPIVFTFNSNALIQDNYRIDSIVCLVDVKHIGIHLDEIKPDGSINEAERQVAFADRIVLNKLDLVSADELDDVEERLRSMNAFATLIKTERSRAPLDQILGLNSFSLEKVVEVDPMVMEEDDPVDDHDHTNDHEHDSDHQHDEHCGHDAGHAHDSDHAHDSHHEHDHAHGHEHEEHHHDAHEHEHEHGHEEHAAKKKKKIHNLSLVSSVGFTIEGLLDVPLFNAFMTQLLQAKAADMFRTKGVLAFADQGDTKFVFQGVHEQINFGPSEKPWQDYETRISKMVFIGKNLDYEYLKTSLLACTVDPSTAKITMHKRA